MYRGFVMAKIYTRFIHISSLIMHKYIKSQGKSDKLQREYVLIEAHWNICSSGMFSIYENQRISMRK